MSRAPTTEPDACALLSWDTKFFGFPIARVLGNRLGPQTPQQVDAWCREHRVRCLYLLADADDAGTSQQAEQAGFKQVDVRVTYLCSLARVTGDNAGCPAGMTAVRPARSEDVPVLTQIARDSHINTRFFRDANFPRGLSEKLYETWIRTSCEGFADQVFVAELKDAPAGYVTCHLDDAQRRGRIGLLAVSHLIRGHGIGQALVVRALEWFETRRVQEVTVVTQGRDLPAQRLYHRCGFRLKSTELWFHKWYEPTEVSRG